MAAKKVIMIFLFPSTGITPHRCLRDSFKKKIGIFKKAEHSGVRRGDGQVIYAKIG